MAQFQTDYPSLRIRSLPSQKAIVASNGSFRRNSARMSDRIECD
jgi:hypothetical protein